jgi:hypothetical protein
MHSKAFSILEEIIYFVMRPNKNQMGKNSKLKVFTISIHHLPA